MGKRSSFERIERDFYPTPPEAVAPLLPHLGFGDSFIEPCAGDMALVNTLEEAGMSCRFEGDIEPRHSDVRRFNALSDDLAVWADGVDCIITNPPWRRDVLHPMIRHFTALRPTWLLFDADWMHTVQSAEFMPLCRKIVSVGRVKWFPETKMTGKDNCCWYLFDARGKGAAQFVGRKAA
ncbi:class I SAM-dependent methyltransferase [Paracoccus sp. (in: a-proteobacteria)]|uniref:class I SAM-dependent methyltransferase n=1 Tax=Paracoccus sp. TaxID=267 RepID=UPI0028A241A0|nr:class I SAM-dependent methyltransferase [Paracoccus sp. (in: a-proteobacteria)]